MEGVEDIPGTALNEGVKFDWEFPSRSSRYAGLDSRAVDVAAQLPHGGAALLRHGDRGADHAEVPSQREIEEMAIADEEALRAGAMGFTTSRTIKHKAQGRPLHALLSAREAELSASRLHEARRTRRAGGQFRLRAR